MIALGALALGLGAATALVVAGGPEETVTTRTITATKRVQPTTTTTNTTVVTTVVSTETTTNKTVTETETETAKETVTETVRVEPEGGD